jgi:osmoprotectant transport system ATP-binding protein
VLQDDGLFPHFTVSQNVALVPSLLGWPQAQLTARVAAMLELVGLGESLAQRYPHQLSGGQRQRVGIARALAGEAPLLLLDEPFGRLDPLTRERLRADFATLCRDLGKTALFVTHDLREALLLGDRVALLRDGRLGFCGTPPQFMATEEPGAVAYRATLTLPPFARGAQAEAPS